MAKEKRNEKSTADREIITTRTINAPRDLVFKAWVIPSQVEKWWGPNGFSTTTKEISIKKGGVWRFTMHGPDGVDYPNIITYQDIISPEKIVILHGDGKKSSSDFTNTVTFEDVGKTTKITMHCVLKTPAERDRVVKVHHAIEGGKQHLARLEQHVLSVAKDETKTAEKNQTFVIERTFNAPLKKVWEAFSEYEEMKQWWGPKGMNWVKGSLDFRKGGFFHYGMKSSNGQMMWGKMVYRKIQMHKKIVLVNSFSDEKGNIVPPPFPMPWPKEMFNTIEFSEQKGKTILKLSSVPINATPEECQNFVEGFGSMKNGFSDTFNQLEAYLQKLK